MDVGIISVILSSATAIIALIAPIISKQLELNNSLKTFLRESAKEKYETKLKIYTELFDNISYLLVNVDTNKKILIASLVKAYSICDEESKVLLSGMIAFSQGWLNHDADNMHKEIDLPKFLLLIDSLNRDLQADYDQIENCTKKNCNRTQNHKE